MPIPELSVVTETRCPKMRVLHRPNNLLTDILIWHLEYHGLICPPKSA
jgi:hypothetical protein